MSNIYPLPREFDLDFAVPRVKPKGSGVEIDWSHPLAEGLVGCWLLNSQSSPDLTGNYDDCVVGGGSIVTSDGNLVLQTTDSEYATIANYDPPHTGTLSFAINRTLDDGTATRVLGFDDNYECRIDTNDTYRNELMVTLIEAQTTGTITVNKWHTISNLYNISTGDGSIYLDGLQDGTSTDHNDDAGGPVTLTLGNRTGSLDTDAFEGMIGFLFLHDRELSAQDAMVLHLDHYQFLKPALGMQAFVDTSPPEALVQQRISSTHFLKMYTPTAMAEDA